MTPSLDFKFQQEEPVLLSIFLVPGTTLGPERMLGATKQSAVKPKMEQRLLTRTVRLSHT